MGIGIGTNPGSEGCTVLLNGSLASRPYPARVAMAKWVDWSRAVRPDWGECAGFQGEPGWALLFDLYVKQKEGRRASVSSASIASGASHGSAIRLIEVLCKAGLTARQKDIRDRRRDWLVLSPKTIKRLDGYFDLLIHHGRLDRQR